MKKKKKTSVFIRWLVSYSIMLGMMVLASFAIYFYSYGVINRQQENVNVIMLGKVQRRVDDYFETARQTVISLLIDWDVEQVIRKKGGFGVEDRGLIYRVYEKIRDKIVVSEEIDSIFIYFLNGDTVLFDDGHVDKRLFYELYYNNNEFDEDEFSNLMEQRWIGEIISITNSHKEEELVFLRNSYPRGNNDLDATIGVSIPHKKIVTWINETKWKENTEVLILSKDKILCSNGELGSSLLEEYSVNDIMEMKAGEVRILGEKYHIVSMPSPVNDFYYVAITPQKEIHREAQKIQVFMFLSMAVCLPVGLIVAYLLTRMNYNPLKQVMDSFGEFDRETYESNEYEWLLEQKKRFYNEHQKAKREITEKEMNLRQQYLYRMISLPFDSKQQKAMNWYNDKLFVKSHVLIALFYVETLDPESVYAKMSRSLGRFVFTNVFEELLAGRLNIEFVDMTDCYACIINSEKEIEELREILEEVLDEMQHFMAEKMKLKVSVAFGSYQQGIDGLYPSYILAREAAEYRESLLDGQFVWYEDIKNKHTLYQYSSEIEQKIINAISIGGSKDACTWMREVIESNYHKREITQTMKKCLFFEILGTIIKGAEQGSRPEYVLNYIDLNTIPEHWNEEKVTAYLENLVKGVCEDIQKNESLKREDKQFGWQVIEYVQKNYQNPDLNISITALHFGITPSYLSALFKEQTGLNLLEYINHTRVEQAKKLLEEGCNLTEVCEQTGFRSSGALIRVFKKITGVTPGQMKKMLGQSGKE